MIKVLILILGFSTITAAAEPVRVHVRHDSQIAKGDVKLGDISDITSTNAEDEQKLAALILGESPQPGKTAVWSATDLSKRLRPYSRVLQDAQLKIPDHITIRRAAINSIARETLKAQIEDALKATLPDSSWEATIVDLNVPRGLEIPRDGSVQVVPPMTRPRGATNFEILVVADGQIVKRAWIPARVKYTARVAVLTQPVEAHQKIAESDVKWETKDMTFSGEVPATAGELKAAAARSRMIPGGVVTRTQLERELAMRFGEEVELSAGDEEFSVSSKGIAQQNAFIGDTVKVRNVATNKIIDGIVTGNGAVKVRY